MSRQINQKKEAFLASVGPWSAGIAVPYAGVSPISVYIPQAHHLNSPVTQQHPGRARAARICVNLRHYLHLQCVPAPVFSACGQTAGVITPENYAPFKTGSEIRLHIFRVGAADPINLRPVFNTPYPKKDEAHSSSNQFIRLVLVDFLGKGGGVPYSRRPFSNTRAESIYNAPGANNKDGLALKSGRNRFNHGFDKCNPGRPFFIKNPNFFQYSLSNPTSREGRINRKNRVGVRRFISSVPVITAEMGSTWESQRKPITNPTQPCVSSLLEPENFAARFRFLCYPKRSSAATCADYTCFPAGSRRQTPFLSLPAPHDGARHDFPVRRKSASLTQVYSPGRFRAVLRHVHPLKRTVGHGPVFDNFPSKSGAVKPGFF